MDEIFEQILPKICEWPLSLKESSTSSIIREIHIKT